MDQRTIEECAEAYTILGRIKSAVYSNSHIDKDDFYLVLKKFPEQSLKAAEELKKIPEKLFDDYTILDCLTEIIVSFDEYQKKSFSHENRIERENIVDFCDAYQEILENDINLALILNYGDNIDNILN